MKLIYIKSNNLNQKKEAIFSDSLFYYSKNLSN